MKKISKKQIVAVVLCITALLSGCGKTDNKQADSGKAVTLTYLIPGSKQSGIERVMKAVNEITEKKIGAKIDMQIIDSGAFTERMTMNMASGSKFDICFTGYINPYKTAVANNGLLEIGDLIDKETPELKKLIPDYVWKDAQYKGKTYAVPNLQIFSGANGIVIKKDLADKYNFDVDSVRSVADIEPLLEQVHKNEPDMYGFLSGKNMLTHFFTLDENNFKDPLASGLIAVENAQGKIEVTTEPEMKFIYDSAKKLHGWYEKGYIRKDVASVMDNSQDLNMGKYTAWLSTYKPGGEGEISANYGYPVYFRQVSNSYVSLGATRVTMTAIGKNSQNPEKAIKFIELLNTDKELFNIISFGIENTDYKKNADGKIEYIENSGYKQGAAWKFGNQFNAYIMSNQEDDVWEQTQKMNDEAVKSKLLGFDLNTDNVSVELTQLESVFSEYKRINTGVEDIDTYYDEFMTKLKNAGLDVVKQDFQKQIDEFLGQ